MTETKKEDIKVNRDIGYDERRKILTLTTSWKTKDKARSIVDTYEGEEKVKVPYNQIMQEKSATEAKIESNETEKEKINKQIRDTKLIKVHLSEEEIKLKEMFEKVQKHVQYENARANLKGYDEDTKQRKEELKEINKFLNEFKAKAKNIKFE